MTFVRNKKPMNLTRLIKALEPMSSLLVPLIPLMTEIVKDSELRRGTGVDKHLRLASYL